MLTSGPKAVGHQCLLLHLVHPTLCHWFVLKEENGVIIQKGRKGRERCRRVKGKSEEKGASKKPIFW